MDVFDLKESKKQFVNNVNDLIRDYELQTQTIITGIEIRRFNGNSYSDEDRYPTFDTIKLTLDY